MESLLRPYMDIDSKQKVIKKRSELILQVQTIDLNPKKPSYSYYTNEYHLTMAQLDGFMYSFSKLKGQHILCDPNVQGHYWHSKDEMEFSFHLYCTEEGSHLLFYQFGEDIMADGIIQKSINTFPESQRYLKFSKNLSQEEKEHSVEVWVEMMIRRSILKAGEEKSKHKEYEN
ncbi:hypothetical protein [Saccharibacillus sp. JS10]|uniref:hypothetical protein n=1 Tax=Saccharibacillus sp. JS10 TaxID=2950552 RepID=UPI002109BC5E|nr:hypothetical protein [Saccharibacillus sp. JS10]MCQ4088909.1 hypothetical protein [Saccharibacillus sp. JS10]